MEIKTVLLVLLILSICYYLFFVSFPVIEGFYDVQIESSNGASQTIYDTSFVELLFSPDDSSSNTTMTNSDIPTNYFSDVGNKCVLSNNTIVVTTAQGASTTYTTTSTSSNVTEKVYYDTNGGYAKIFSDGIHYFVEVQPYNAPLFVLTSNPPASQPAAAATSPYMQGGIPYSMIAPGTEDLYILKSEIVPPVCPKCPDYTGPPPSSEQCPPCPACARCPEPSFECKKVPNYQSIDQNAVPSPILNDFSSFGL